MISASFYHKGQDNSHHRQFSGIVWRVKGNKAVRDKAISIALKSKHSGENMLEL
jgi:hypothetical protein